MRRLPFVFASWVIPLVLVMVLGTAVFLVFGALLSWVLPLDLFRASALAIGATLATIVVMHFTSTVLRAAVAPEHGDEGEEDEEDPEEDSETVADSDGTPVHASDSNKCKPGRNEPCPCGSGRKYKHCCGQTLDL